MQGKTEYINLYIYMYEHKHRTVLLGKMYTTHDTLVAKLVCLHKTTF